MRSDRPFARSAACSLCSLALSRAISSGIASVGTSGAELAPCLPDLALPQAFRPPRPAEEASTAANQCSWLAQIIPYCAGHGEFAGPMIAAPIGGYLKPISEKPR